MLSGPCRPYAETGRSRSGKRVEYIADRSTGASEIVEIDDEAVRLCKGGRLPPNADAELLCTSGRPPPNDDDVLLCTSDGPLLSSIERTRVKRIGEN